MSEAEIAVTIIILLPLILVSANLVRIDLAGVLTALALALLQLAGLPLLGQGGSGAALLALSGLAQPVTVTLFSLFVVTRALERSGVTRWAAKEIMSRAHSSERRLIIYLSSLSAFFSLFMNNLAAGALVLPSAMEVSRRTGIKPSKLLIPVAYGSCLGGAATYFTTNNIIASDMLRAAIPPQAPLHILDFTPTGGLVALAGLVFLAWFGPKILPNREPSAEQEVARRTGTELETAYDLKKRLWQVKVMRDSPLAGRELKDSGLGERFGVTVLGLLRKGTLSIALSAGETIRAGDVLLVVGRPERLAALERLNLQAKPEGRDVSLSSQGVTFVEVILVPQSKAEGHTLRDLQFRTIYGLNVVAIRRDGQSYRTDVAQMKLRQGDSLLAVGSRERLEIFRRSSDFILIEADPADQPVETKGATLTILVGLAAIAAAIAGFPVYLAMLICAVLLVLLRVLPMEEIYRTMEWQAIVLIAGMYPLSLAIVNSGLAQHLGGGMVAAIAPLGPYGLVAGAYLLTGLLSQVVAGQVTTLITAPIFISAAISFHTNPQAVAVAAAIACSTSFLTPLSHPVNTLMIGPGNYSFTDFFRAGWALSLLSVVMLMLGMYLFWNL